MKTKIADLSERISVRGFDTERNERGDILKSVEFERCQVWAKVYPLSSSLLTFAVNLHRRKFPANERVHIAISC